MGNGSSQLVVTFSPIERPVDVLSEHRAIDVIQQMQTFNDMVIFPDGAFRFVFARVRAEFPDDDPLGGRLPVERDHDAPDVFPFLHDELLVDLSDGPQEPVLIVLCRMLKSIERRSDLFPDVLVPRSELVAGDIQDGKVYGVDPVRIRRVDLRNDIGRVAFEEVVQVTTFVFVRADDLRVRRQVVDHQVIGDNALPEAEVLRRVTGVDGVDPGLELLTVAAGVELSSDVVLPENGQLRDGVADDVVCRFQRLRTDEVV